MKHLSAVLTPSHGVNPLDFYTVHCVKCVSSPHKKNNDQNSDIYTYIYIQYITLIQTITNHVVKKQ